MDPRPPRLALWVLLPILAGITLGGELLLFHFGLGADALAAPAIAVVAGLAYLAWAAPARPPTSRPAPAEDEEPFDDPVEEAVRADAAPKEPRPSETPGAPATSPAPAEDPSRDDGLE